MTGRQAGDGALPDFFAVGGDVGREHARVDWAATPLGPVEGWPQSLQTSVSVMLSSKFSMWMAWGPDLTFFCNDAYRRDTLGRKYPWALGQPFRVVWHEVWNEVELRIRRVLSTGEATWDESLLLFLERSGYPEETYHTFSYSPLRDDDGHVVGLLCVVSEDTVQVIGERRMATLRDLGSAPSAARNEQQIVGFIDGQLARNARDLPFTLTYLFDAGGAARLAGSSGFDGEHAAAPAVLAEDGVWPLSELRRGEIVTVELGGVAYPTLPTGDWREPPVQALAVPLLQQGESPMGFLVAGLNRYRPLDEGYRGFVSLVAARIAADIGLARSYRAEQLRAEQLAELDRAKTAFFSNASHELRTPLTLILDPVDTLRRDDRFDEDTRHELDIIWRSALRLSKLVNALLDFSRIEAGRAQVRYQPVDLGVLTAELASVFRSAVERAGLLLVVDCAPLAEPVYVDPDMWEKVLFNLLSNALKFTFDGTISVRVGREGDQATVVVADTGVGVPADEVARLFERFHRIENTRSRSHEGSGIGLALVKELIGLHGGSIDVDSVEGEGTVFTIRLPLGSAHLPADAVAVGSTVRAAQSGDAFVQEALRWSPESATHPGADLSSTPGHDVQGPPMRVLVADDNADMRDYLSRLLRSDGYVVESVADGGTALKAVRAAAPDLVISDVMMPVLDGLGLVAALRADRRTASVPVLLLSARAGPEASVTGLRAGADDYLVKPFAATELLARVRTNIVLARMRDHHARWRTALIDSLQEALFVCDETGAVTEINTTFADMLGYDSAGLPYPPPYPWWPSAESDPDAHREVSDAFASLMDKSHGTLSAVPVTHRDGHRLWVTATFTHAEDPDTGRKVIVGTLRDVTAEHYVVLRESALAALNEELAQADTLADAVAAAAEQLRAVWRARRVVAATWRGGEADVPTLVCAGEAVEWGALSDEHRGQIAALHDRELLEPESFEPGEAGIALQHPQGVLVIHLELTERRHFTADDCTLLTVLAGRLGQGLQRVHQIDQQRETALALQHAILGPPTSDGFAVRYQPATRPLQVGGDWYDVVDLDDGRIGLIVGDCVGHGLSAATVMGQLRSACRALLLENPSPAAVLSALDRFATRLPGARCTTAFCAVLSPGSGELAYSCAGQPPPILVDGGGAVALLDSARATPLGVTAHGARPETHTVLPAGAILLLYTDGLVERRRLSIDEGIDRAGDLVSQHRSDALDALADRLMTTLAPPGGYRDDVAVLVYRQPAALDLELGADVGELAQSRHALRDWLDEAGAGADEALDVLIAVGEALANAIEHGHRDHPEGTVYLHAVVVAERVYVTVTDTGSWKTPQAVPARHRGRGLELMRALMQDVTIESRPAGTTVQMHRKIA
ncbi:MULTISPECIES: SpoIIE family protein phosphatase [Mycobacteriaceae]|uniref:SpoIIE family protein phosphatase n=1 Tax=Mycolicibacterium parafortuitum TaxID=39692 RepID=A0ACC6ME55_MYCPF|nr:MULTISPECIES: SpoIIE family protein phosphatase [Mycobacteriaceae]MDZ5085197.1 SpoIIE family protein phosphatase [Mycolicibacterium parafortuitum]GFM17912.1 PAS/PAC sensor hybrid histidine kinase [Mycobacterium sp. PO1]GFM26061.1 PAS/PAC sensor hybrid histidine kinase [Mycobacterium sp. PO2]